MRLVLIGLGANMPGRYGAPPQAVIEAAIAGLACLPGLRLAARSRLWDSAAWPDPSGPRYVNAVAVLEATPDMAAPEPAALLARLLALEADEGRIRGEANAPRPLDLDLLAVGDLRRDRPDPILPHPRMQERRFVMAPLAEIMPAWRHPVLGLSAAALLDRLPPGDCRPIAAR